VFYEQTGENEDIAMSHLGTDGDREIFACTLDPDSYVGLIFYYFRFENDGGSFFYGNNSRNTGGKCAFYGGNIPPAYQLSIYSAEKKVPKWFGEGTTYHIFPDRFCRLSIPPSEEFADRDRRIHENWEDIPEFKPSRKGSGELWNCDFFAGSIKGIISKLDYLDELGVSCIYLSPIFEAFSNHRYDTADYMKIDPMLGTEDDFTLLCREAKEHGIRIILDGVFNHTGSDSVYFNKEGRYSEAGAYQSKNSPYYRWYSFESWPDKYASWWGIGTLPQVNENTPSYTDFICRNSDSVVKRWLSAGASGWRLDVADELPDGFIAEINSAARSVKEDAVIIGEVWEDASNKVSYSERRQYILQNMLDGVMNYPFRDALIGYLRGDPAYEFMDRMECLRENYPSEVLYSCMNILGTHDTPRILTLLGGGDDILYESKDIQSRHLLTYEQRQTALSLLKLGSVIQFCFIGSPCVYYGDEAGMEGWGDPFNRRSYIWGSEDLSIQEWYRRLGAIRKSESSLRGGVLRYLSADKGILAFERYNITDGRECDNLIIVCNRDPFDAELRLEGKYTELMTGVELISYDKLVLPKRSAMILKKF
jgi:glycosidase